MGQNRSATDRRKRKRPGSYDRRWSRWVRKAPREEQKRLNQENARYQKEYNKPTPAHRQ